MRHHNLSKQQLGILDEIADSTGIPAPALAKIIDSSTTTDLIALADKAKASMLIDVLPTPEERLPLWSGQPAPTLPTLTTNTGSQPRKLAQGKGQIMEQLKEEQESGGFWDGAEVICTITRKQLLEDGSQVLVQPATSKEAGIVFPVFLTDSVVNKYVAVPKGCEDMQDAAGRLWDVLWMFRHAAKQSDGSDRLHFQLYVVLEPDKEAELVELLAVCGPVDFDDPSPAITIMEPWEE